MFSLHLRTLLFTVFSIITVLLTCSIIFFYTQSIKEQAIDGITQWATSLSSSASSIIVDYIIEEDYAGLEDIVVGYTDAPLILRALITDPDGVVLADSDFSAFRSTLPLLTGEANLHWNRKGTYLEQKTESFTVTTSLLFDDTIFGYVQFEVSKQPMLNQLTILRKKTLQAGLFWGGICLFCSWILSRMLTKSLEHIAGTAKKISRGSYRLSDRQRGIVEIENLCDSLHTMSTALEERENLLLASEKKYREIFEQAIEGIFQVSMEGKFLIANPRMAILLGYTSPDELLHDVTDISRELFVDPGDFSYLLKLLTRNSSVTGFESRLFRKTGAVIWVSLNVRIVLNTDNSPLFMEGLLEDISGRKEANEELLAEQERLSVTLRSIGDAVITTDTAGIITLINKIAETLTCWSQNEAIGRPLDQVFQIIDKKTGSPGENPVHKVLSSGLVEHIANNTILVDKQGREKSISDSAAPIRDEQSSIIGVVIVFRDVTEQNMMEEEVLKVKKLESIGILAGGIAHDFNNILAAIVGNLNLALLDKSIAEPTQKLLVSAEKASLRAKDLTLQLLTFSKGGEPVKETSSIAEIIRDSAEFVLHGSNVVCRYHFSDDLWLVDIDRGQMSQVIQNIILNASHAMADGGSISVTCENITSTKVGSGLQSTPRKGVKITISDSGIGIPATVIDRIFDPYFSTKQKGSGLGLAISNSIILKHNGRISVESTPGKGTTFTIYLPASLASLKKAVIAEHKSQPMASARIMVMDDEEVVREVVQAMLVQLGHEAILVADGSEALSIYKEQKEKGEPVDALIMDLTIPGGIGGKEAIQQILSVDPQARAIVSSGYSNDPIMAHCRQYGFKAAVVKPYQLDDLEKVLTQVLTVGD